MSESYKIGNHTIIRVWEDLELNSDLTELKKTVEHDHSIKNLVLAFTEKSSLYSRTVSVLLEVFRILQRRHGSLSFIKPNHSISFVLNTVGLGHLVRIFGSEEEISRDKLAA